MLRVYRSCLWMAKNAKTILKERTTGTTLLVDLLIMVRRKNIVYWQFWTIMFCMTIVWWFMVMTILWYYDTMILWYYDTMILWYYDTMILWYYDTMILWYYGTMVLWYYGTMMIIMMMMMMMMMMIHTAITIIVTTIITIITVIDSVCCGTLPHHSTPQEAFHPIHIPVSRFINLHLSSSPDIIPFFNMLFSLVNKNMKNLGVWKPAAGAGGTQPGLPVGQACGGQAEGGPGRITF